MGRGDQVLCRMTPILLMVIIHKIHGKDFLVEVANSALLNSGDEQLGKLLSNNLENYTDTDTFVEELQTLKLKKNEKSGNDYTSMAKEGRCEGGEHCEGAPDGTPCKRGKYFDGSECCSGCCREKMTVAEKLHEKMTETIYSIERMKNKKPRETIKDIIERMKNKKPKD